MLPLAARTGNVRIDLGASAPTLASLDFPSLSLLLCKEKKNLQDALLCMVSRLSVSLEATTLFQIFATHHILYLGLVVVVIIEPKSSTLSPVTYIFAGVRLIGSERVCHSLDTTT